LIPTLSLINERMEIKDLIISQGAKKMVDFVVLGEPIAQNGWKLAWRGRGLPYLYDSNSREKKKLKAAVQAALLKFGEDVPVFKNGTKVFLGVVFSL
jgi:hypothetical protein